MGTEPRAHDPGAPLADRVDLIEEHEGGRLLLRLLEQLPNPGRAEADEHLDELGAAHEEERNVRLTGDRPCEQRLAAPGRTKQQHTFRYPAPEALILLRVLQELDDLLELLLRLVDTCDVGERRLHLFAVVDLDLVLAHVEGVGRTPSNPAEQEVVGDPHQQHERQDAREE